MCYPVLSSLVMDWIPSDLDHDLIDDDHWYDALSDFPEALSDNLLDAIGNYRNVHVSDLFITYSILDNLIIPDLPWLYQAHQHQDIQAQQQDLLPQLCMAS